MLWVNSNIEKYKEFKALFKEEHGGQFLDLSKVPSGVLLTVRTHLPVTNFLDFVFRVSISSKTSLSFSEKGK
jgi:hypothetical protein